MAKKYTKEEFINKSNKTHKNKYDYNLVEYKNSRTKVKIVCNIHGIFEQSPKDHIFGNGCPSCCKNQKLTQEEFIKKSKQTHGDKYDYSLVKYNGAKNTVNIICNNHGVFNQIAHNHICGQGCPSCANVNKLTTETFIIKSKVIHGDIYDYSLVEYKNNKTKVKIICKKHGIFEVRPDNHINNKSKCPKCYGLNKSKSEIIDIFEKIHGKKYDYSLIDYKTSNSKMLIGCKKHGIFLQSFKSHGIRKCGCPICKESYGEKEIRKLLEFNDIKYIIEFKFNDCRDINPLPFDFYLPDYNTCIEFDGRQHFESIEHFGGIKGFQLIQNHDIIKTNYCKNNNIKLLRIKYNENINNKLQDLISTF